MYPPSKREALLWQLQTEKAIQDLAMAAYELWLPRVAMAMTPTVLAGALDDLPPDPNQIPLTQGVWDYVMDNLLLEGLGMIYGQELADAFVAMGGEPATERPDLEVVPPVTPPAGLPTQAELATTARRLVAKRLNQSIQSVVDIQDKLATIPTARSLQSSYLATVRNRMVNTPDTVFREIASRVDEGLAAGDSPLEVRKAVQQHLGIQTGDWPGRAVTVARTESVGAQSAATIQAAQIQAGILGETDTLEQVWLCTLDSKTRKTHFAADGQRVALGSRFKVGRAELRHPGDPGGPAAEVINCRCRAAVLAVDESLPGEGDRHTERGSGDSTVKNRAGSQADEIARRAADGVIRARDDEDGVGSVAASASAPGGATMAEEPTEETPVTDFRSFTTVLAVIGTPTDDGRMFATDIDLSFRDFPLPLLWQKQSNMGHFDSFTVGVIESASVDGTNVIGTGYMLNSPEADEAVDQASHGITAPSVDLGDASWKMTDIAGNEIDWEQIWADPNVDEDTVKVYETVTAARLLGATLVSIPAFGQTSITIGEMVAKGDAEEALVASLVASVAAQFTPPTYPDEFFTDPKFSGPTLPQITAEGRIYGHLATYNTCHVGIQDRCVMAPRSNTDYAWFHTSPPVLTQSGEKVKVGRLTVNGGHAGDRLGVGPAVAHYDETGSCFALVHMGEDEHGVWFSGVPSPNATPEQIAEGLSAPLSGDWRVVAGNLELVAALAVNTPGFPILASGATDERDAPVSLVASLGPCKDTADGPQLNEAQLKVFAKLMMAEMRAAEHRTKKAQALVNQVEAPKREERRQAALSLIQKVEN